MKRYAAPMVYFPDQGFLKYHVVEMGEDGAVLRHYPLTEELPATIWVTGAIIVESFGEVEMAYLVQPFDFERRQPAPNATRQPLAS